MQNKPPTAIIVVCAVLAIFTLLGLTGIFAGGLWSLYGIVDTLLSVAVIYGLWIMKKWSVILYTVLFLISLVISFMTGGLSFMLIVPVILLVVMYMNYGLVE